MIMAFGRSGIGPRQEEIIGRIMFEVERRIDRKEQIQKTAPPPRGACPKVAARRAKVAELAARNTTMTIAAVAEQQGISVNTFKQDLRALGIRWQRVEPKT